MLKHPDLNDEDSARLWHDVKTYSGDYFAFRLLSWVKSTALCVEQVATLEKQVPEAIEALMWIRLWGIFTDVKQSQQRQVNTHRDFFAQHKATIPQHIEAKLRMIEDVVSKIDAMETALTSDELVYLDFRRHLEAHPFQDKYRLRMDLKRKEINDGRTVLNRDFTVEEMNEARGRVTEAFERDERAISVHFARTLHPHVQALLAAVVVTCTPTY